MDSTQLPSKSELLEKRKQFLLPTAIHYHEDPVHLVRAQGCHVYDEEGREYLDAVGGIVSIASGHNHPKIKEALKEMLEENEIQHTSLLYLSRHVVELAEATLDRAPKGFDQVQFTNSGSESNELAFMLVRNATGESTILSLKHGYHGGTAATLSQCGQSTWKWPAQPQTNSVHVEAPYCYRCPFGKQPSGCALECAKEVERTIQTATHGKIAGMIIEPIMGVGGFIDPPKEYFDEVTEIVHRYGGKYISDEVQTGAGRCGGAFFLTDELGIDADVITMAKGFGNGAAIGGVVAKSNVTHSFNGKMYFNTFGGDPYQSRQAKVNLDVIDEEKLIDNARERGNELRDGLEQLMKRHSIIGDVRGRGLLIGFELVKDPKTKEPAVKECAELMDCCKDEGLLIGKGGLYRNVIRVAPPLCITQKQTQVLLQTLDEVLGEVGHAV